MTIFQKIIDKEIPATIVYEDDLCLAFKDISPQAPTHLLLIPKVPIKSMAELTTEHNALMGHMMVKVAEIAKIAGLSQGYRVVTNIGEDGGQEVPHLHFHILGGRSMSWPPG